MYCSSCGQKLPPGSAFCSKCGMKQMARTSYKTWIIALIVVLAAFLCIGGFILLDKLTSGYNKNVPADSGMTVTGDTGSGNAAGTMDAVSDKDIIGMWSSEGTSGELVDPATGYASGSIYNGEWYVFRDDGTFRYVIVSSGQVLSGGVVWEGKFSVRGGAIHLTGITESWYPNPAATGQKESYENKRTDDAVLKYRCSTDKNTLIINNSDYFTRVEG